MIRRNLTMHRALSLIVWLLIALSGAGLACAAPTMGVGDTDGERTVPPPSPRGSALARNACASELDGHPTALGCTGLYADAALRTLSSDVSEYEPAIALWADGASKRRYIHLPRGTTIDGRDVDHWVFPVGTKLWKEFSIAGRRIETRYTEKKADGWFRTTYVWSADQTTATENTSGVIDIDSTGYDVPPQSECATCHEGAKDGVLGFEAVGLSAPGATGLTMAELERLGWLRTPPHEPLVVPGTQAQSAALGWLHANCGNACHNRTTGALAHGTGLFMRLTSEAMQTVEGSDVYLTAVNVPSGFQPIPGESFLRVAPGDVAHSAIPYRAGRRDSSSVSGVQMPPIGTHVVDAQGVATLEAWIASM